MNNTNWLAHYDIEGQKWGVRRYQNEDGSLTEEGRKRYGYDTKKTSTPKLFSPEWKAERLRVAKEQDKWDMEFLETVDDEMLYSGDTNRLIKEYEKYLDNLEERYG